MVIFSSIVRSARRFEPIIGTDLIWGIPHELTSWSGANHTQLSWQPHINKLQNKTSKPLGLLKRPLNAAPPASETNGTRDSRMPFVWQTRPTLEFATCAWGPYKKTVIQTIDSVQRAAGEYRTISCVSDMRTNLM